MSYAYDPAKEACDPQFHPCMDCDMCKVGPGGNSTLTENNEKGILESGLHRLLTKHQVAELRSDHDSYKQDIYATNSVGDGD